MSISSYSGFSLSDQDVLGEGLVSLQAAAKESLSLSSKIGSLLLDVIAQLLTNSSVTCTCLSDDEVKENDAGNHDCDKPNDPEHIVLFLGQGVGSVNSGEVSHRQSNCLDEVSEEQADLVILDTWCT